MAWLSPSMHHPRLRDPLVTPSLQPHSSISPPKYIHFNMHITGRQHGHKGAPPARTWWNDQPPALASWLPTDGYPAEAWPPECHCLCVSCLYLGNHLPGEWWPVSASARTTHTPQSGCCSHARCPRHHPQPCRSLPSVKSRAGSCGSQAIPTCSPGPARKAQP